MYRYMFRYLHANIRFSRTVTTFECNFKYHSYYSCMFNINIIKTEKLNLSTLRIRSNIFVLKVVTKYPIFGTVLYDTI